MTIVANPRSMVMQLLRECIPVARIAERLGVSRQTIYNWKQRAEAGPAEVEPRPKKSKLDSFRNRLMPRRNCCFGACETVRKADGRTGSHSAAGVEYVTGNVRYTGCGKEG